MPGQLHTRAGISQRDAVSNCPHCVVFRVPLEGNISGYDCNPCALHSKFLSDKKPSVGQLVIKSGVNLQILYALSLA